MQMTRRILNKASLAFFLLAFSLPAVSFAAPPFSDDSDLSGTPFRPGRARADVPLDLAPDRIETGDAPGAAIRVVRENHGRLEEIEGLRFGVAALGNRCSGVATLSDRHFSVGNGSQPYRIRYEAECGKPLTLVFSERSNGGQALGIWRIATLAREKLGKAAGLDFWNSVIRFVWPSNGDYYSWGTVNITEGHKWDVVGHELGHAVYDLADIGVFGGGQHYIDRCYSDALALSEGWASFFSAWLSVDLADADAKFEFMVPRRAPIRFENVPADVCAGPTNEWRVTAFFWDLIDLNRDGETLDESFARLWTLSRNARFRDADEAARAFERGGIDSAALKTAWNLNFSGRHGKR